MKKNKSVMSNTAPQSIILSSSSSSGRFEGASQLSFGLLKSSGEFIEDEEEEDKKKKKKKKKKND